VLKAISMCPPLSQEIPLDVAVNPEEAVKVALTRHQAGDREEAERLYRQVLEAHPRDPTALYLYGMFNAEAGRLEPAEILFAQVAEICPDKVEGHLALANLATQRGQQDQAIASFRNVLRIQPNHATTLTNLASLLIQRGFTADDDFDSAIQICRSAIALFPDPAPAWAILGRILLADGRTAESIEAYRASVAAGPEKFNGWAGLALALLASGDGAGSLEAADRAIALNPELPDAWAARGSALLAVYHAQDALSAFERGVALAPDQARMHLGLGDAYAELDRNTEAVEHLVRAVTLDPTSKWANANLGSVLYRCGDLENAEHYCKLALAADPALAVAHRNLAGIYTDQGRLDLAKVHCDEAFGLNNVLVKGAANAKARVLIPTTSDNGNIPYKHLLPLGLYTRIEWFIEYAKDVESAKLPPYDVVFNIIGDPDYAARTDAPVAAFHQTCERPWLNDPAKVALTRRDRLPSLLGDIEDVVVPAAARLEASDETRRDLSAWLATVGVTTPVLIRPMGSHGGRGLFLARTAAELEGAETGEGLYATQYVDSRGVDGRFRKYRVVFIDRKPYPYHLAIKDDWLVHYFSSEMSGDAPRQAEELRFLENPVDALGERAMVAITAIGERLDLDYAGVDFSIMPDGRVLVFEANATMLVHPETEPEFLYKNIYFERISQAFQTLVDRHAHGG
jgi:tetratricopeptide (TPR) repeat protein